MTPEQKRQKVADIYKTCIGRNTYSQDISKRECAFTPYKDGKYYSDCSSSIRLAYKKAKVGFDNIGGNTVGMYSSNKGVKIDCVIKNGIPTDVNSLRVGDILLFAGSDKSRKSSEYVGHVEMIYSIHDNKVTLCGHGSGNPSFKDMVDYCKKCQNSSTSTSRGNKGLICVKRFIMDNFKVSPPPVKEYTENEEILWELSNRHIISNVDLWREAIANNTNYYWLARKIVHYIRTKTHGETADVVYDNVDAILWELQNRKVISDIDLWRTEMTENSNIYWLCLKAVHYMRTY